MIIYIETECRKTREEDGSVNGWIVCTNKDYRNVDGNITQRPMQGKKPSIESNGEYELNSKCRAQTKRYDPERKNECESK